MAGGREYDPERLKELVVYIAERSAGDTRFGMTKLNKILFYADFRSYLRSGKSITGAVYQHLPEGPAPHQMLPCLQSLTRGREIIEKHEPTYAGTQRRLIATREAELGSFTGTEIAVVDQVISEFAPLTNVAASQLSHATVAWRLTHLKQEVPYQAAYLSDDDPSEDDLDWLAQVSLPART
jgi:hypothetical protein